MKKLTLLIAAVVGAVLVAGVAAAAPGLGAQADDRPMDGTNSPWTNSDDPRLEQFQERYDLTDAEMEQVRAAVQETVQNGGDRTAIRATVTEQLSEFGIDDPELGPVEGFGPHDDARNNGMKAKYGCFWRSRGMKVHFRVYRYEKTVEKEVSNAEEAQEILDALNKENKDLIFEPYLELEDGCEVNIPSQEPEGLPADDPPGDLEGEFFNFEDLQRNRHRYVS